MNSFQHPVIVLHNTTYEDLRCLISFIYRGQCLITKNQLPSLLSLAKLLQIQGLCDMKLPQEMGQSNSPVDQDTPKELLTNPTEDALKVQDTYQKSYIADLIDSFKKSQSNRENELQLSKTEAEIAPDSSASKKGAKDLLYKCFLCGKYLSNQYNLRVHMETHEEGCYVCQSCPHVSRSRDALRKHVSYRHQEQYNTKKRKKAESSS